MAVFCAIYDIHNDDTRQSGWAECGGLIEQFVFAFGEDGAMEQNKGACQTSEHLCTHSYHLAIWLEWASVQFSSWPGLREWGFHWDGVWRC